MPLGRGAASCSWSHSPSPCERPSGGERRLLPFVLAIATLEVAATVPLIFALHRGPVAIASVVASLYPVTTVFLAGLVLHERLSRLQYVGVTCALVAVVLVSTGVAAPRRVESARGDPQAPRRESR